MAMQIDSRRVKDAVTSFFDNELGRKYRDDIRSMMAQKRRRLIVNFNDFRDFDSEHAQKYSLFFFFHPFFTLFSVSCKIQLRTLTPSPIHSKILSGARLNIEKVHWMALIQIQLKRHLKRGYLNKKYKLTLLDSKEVSAPLAMSLLVHSPLNSFVL